MGKTYRRESVTRLPKEKRRIRREGSGDDKNKWLSCWNCGFPINLSRDSIGGSGSGIIIKDFPVSSDRAYGLGLELDGKWHSFWETPFNLDLSLYNDGPDGSAQTDLYTPRIAEAGSGCPFCGCKNL